MTDIVTGGADMTEELSSQQRGRGEALAELLGETIKRIHGGDSVSSLFV